MVRDKRWVLLVVVLITALSLAGCLGIGRYRLDIEVVPEGSGTVERDPNQKNYEKNKVVNLTAVPGTGFKFSKWDGELTGTDPAAQVTMSKDLTIKAIFVPIDELTFEVVAIPEGAGEFTVNPEKPSYTYGDVVEVTAVPAPSWEFSKWVGLDQPGPTATVTITEDMVLQAEFVIATEAFVEGYVTDAQAGPFIAGAEVVYNGQVATTTDAKGYFHLTIPAGQQGDIIVTRPDGGATRVQGVQVAEGKTATYNQVPVRPSFHPGWSSVPPTAVVNVEPGQVLKGIVEIEVAFESGMPVAPIYLYLNGEQRSPRTGVEFDLDELAVTIDATKYPDGEGTLRILAYDDNEFAVLYVIPIIISNPLTDLVVPDPVTYVALTAKTYNENIRFYSVPDNAGLLQAELGFQPEAAPPGGMLTVDVQWIGVANADGYAVERSFDGENYTLLGHIPHSGAVMSYADYSPQLAVTQKTFYRIVPYNNGGYGAVVVERDVTPLPAMDVLLVSPGNGETDVELNPTFEWEHVSEELFPVGAVRQYQFWIHDGLAWRIGSGLINNSTTFQLNQPLEPGHVYNWDIYNSQTVYTYSNDAYGWAQAISYGGYPDPTSTSRGAKNGEFIFTTTLEIDENGGDQ